MFTYPEQTTVIPPSVQAATFKGWAYSGEHAVARVEVSVDGGAKGGVENAGEVGLVFRPT